MVTTAQWLEGARPRTLPAAIAPVAVGTGVAAATGAAVWWKALLALAVALGMQVGVNYANDYSDGVRGADDDRVGPLRLVGSGVAEPAQVRRAAFMALGVASVAGFVLAAVTSWWLLVLGMAAIAAAWFYTGGSRPYGYRAMGELSVFVFFGLVAVNGTAYVQAQRLSWLALVAAVPVGLLACALLVVNNLRDLPRDRAVGKRTLAVVLGDAATRRLYAALLVVPFLVALALVAVTLWAAVALLALPLATAPVFAVLRGAAGRDLIPALQGTGRVQLAYGLLLGLGFTVSW